MDGARADGGPGKASVQPLAALRAGKGQARALELYEAAGALLPDLPGLENRKRAARSALGGAVWQR